MTPTEFEILTQKLFAKRLKKEFGYDIPVHHQKEYISLTGNTYKIDVSYSFTLFDIDYLTFVECKYWDSFVTREKVGYFKSILDDLKIHKGILITTKGFQSGAVTYAQTQNIGLIKVTNDKYFETYSPADGGIDKLSEMLIHEDVLDSDSSYTTVGLFTPSNNILDFISKNYGQELAHFLEKEFSPDSLDNPTFELNPKVKEKIFNVPKNWYKDYTNFETCGLNYKLKNESELRILNMTMFLLKN